MKSTSKSNRRFSFDRRTTAAALALALCGAFWLNGVFAGDTPAQAIPTDAVPVAVTEPFEQTVQTAVEGENQQAGNKNYGEAQLVSVNQDTGTAFFEQARLARTKARDEALDALKKTLKNADMSSKEKEELTQKLSEQVDHITMESTLETLIKAKGFVDCVVSIEGVSADVTVMTENDALTAEEVTRIRDILLSKCHGMRAQDITVVEVK